MKKLLIATSILFAFSSAYAQKPNVKPTVKQYQSKTSDANPSKSTPVSNEAKPNVKPVGPSTKPAPVSAKPNVKPVGKQSTKPAPVMTKDSPIKGGSNPVGISTSRASQSAVGTAKEKPSSKVEKKEKSSTSRASQSAVGTAKEKPSSKVEKKEKIKT